MSLAESRFKLSMFDKLTAQKKGCEDKIKELSYELDLLRKSQESDFEYREKLSKRRDTQQEKLRNTILELDQLEKDMNGGASLNPFLDDEIKDKVKDLKDQGLERIDIH